jgi:uncharacterized protein (DUF169 family)
VAIQDNQPEVKAFLETLGLREEPMGVYYTAVEPEKGISPKPRILPTAEMEARGEVDWQETFANFSCVIGVIWRARQKGTAAYFDQERIGCLGGAFFLGFLKPQLEFIVHYVSTGIPGILEGECYLESPEVTRRFYETIDPRPAPQRFCVVKPLSQFAAQEKPEVVIFFARAEIICGLNQLATFVTNDFEAVYSPFGAGCANIVTWPLKYLSQGRLKAVLGGWDPSDRKFLKVDEITFAVPGEMFDRMVSRWRESFLTRQAWGTVRQKIDLSRKVWKET